MSKKSQLIEACSEEEASRRLAKVYAFLIELAQSKAADEGKDSEAPVSSAANHGSAVTPNQEKVYHE